ncbi:MAG: hypothetical protein A2042_01715 [Candidatus Schekmanbacteria bacterium GWA2_38_11]|uniref:Putative regulatory protein FmdB zinc ribbon domain-containing protein n=1 Tax=Candidatus Schekmanbacteria bacterium GWA2_38_11 TaxID=1817876 RepID=A0A1F7RBV7_9BACT|nr:MAG: hypothetical protein A2042_01715 [Candidatus Schekmanbacteria bacterium GWA2_38_11]
MPIFEFQCSDCQEEFEKLVFNQDNPVECPRCHKTNVVKKMSVCGFSSGGKFTPSSGASGCSSCTSSSCSTCKPS